jgi:hypothetical protein
MLNVMIAVFYQGRLPEKQLIVQRENPVSR